MGTYTDSIPEQRLIGVSIVCLKALLCKHQYKIKKTQEIPKHRSGPIQMIRMDKSTGQKRKKKLEEMKVKRFKHYKTIIFIFSSKSFMFLLIVCFFCCNKSVYTTCL